MMKIDLNLPIQSQAWCLDMELNVLISSVHFGYIYVGKLKTPRTVFWPAGLEQLEPIYTQDT